MKALVVGGGGREHGHLLEAGCRVPKVTELLAGAPGNRGRSPTVAQCVPIKATDVEAMVAWAKEHAMDFVMVARTTPWPWAWWTPWRRRGSPPSAPGQRRCH